jgi:hypothetical protein
MNNYKSNILSTIWGVKVRESSYVWRFMLKLREGLINVKMVL